MSAFISKTKIVATLGPASFLPAVQRRLSYSSISGIGR